MAAYLVDLEADFANEDETGYIWVFLDEAREPERIIPGAVLTLREGKDLAMGQVIDLALRPMGPSCTSSCCRAPSRITKQPSSA